MSHLLGYPTEFAHNDAWTFLNVSSLYWHIFRRWPHLQQSSSGTGTADDHADETVLLEESGQKISLYRHTRIAGGSCKACLSMITCP